VIFTHHPIFLVAKQSRNKNLVGMWALGLNIIMGLAPTYSGINMYNIYTIILLAYVIIEDPERVGIIAERSEQQNFEKLFGANTGS
jgi:hypothetical protein